MPDLQTNDHNAIPSWATASKLFSRLLKSSSLVGAALTLVYFTRYRYNPIDSFASLGAIVAPVAFVSVLLGTSLFVMWGAPAGAFNLIGSDQRMLNLWTSLRSRKLTVKKSGPNWTFSIWRIALLFLALFALPWISVFAIAMPADDFSFGHPAAVAWISGFISVALTGFFITSEGAEAAFDGKAQRVKRILYRLAICCVIAFMATWPLLTFLNLVDFIPHHQAKDGITTNHLISLAIALIGISNTINMFVALEPLKSTATKWLVQSIVAFTSFLALTTSMEVEWPLLDQVMTAASVRVQAAQLVLNAQACQAINRYSGVDESQNPSSVAAQTPVGDMGCILRHVTVVSRLGDNWRLACEASPNLSELEYAKALRRGIVIRGKDVESWAVEDPAQGKTDPRLSAACAALKSKAKT